MSCAGCGRDLYETHARDASIDGNEQDANAFDAALDAAPVPSRDPLSADWMMIGDPQELGHLGGTVAPAGDVNADGYDDVLVAAYEWDGVGPDEGRVYLLLGAADGLSTDRMQTLDAADQAGALFGASAIGVGDLDGDTFDDVAIGAEAFDVPGGMGNEGRIYFFRGTAIGLEPWFEIDGPMRMNAYFGNPVVPADVDGDGRTDLVVGARNFSAEQIAEGRVFVYLGAGGSVFGSPQAWDPTDHRAAAFGTAIGCVDVDGDGDDDCLIDAYSWGRRDSGDPDEVEAEGRTYFYRGTASGLDPTEVWTRDPLDSYRAHYAGAIAAVGDVTGDGLGDILVGSWGFDGAFEDQGVAHLHVGSASGLVQTPTVTFDSPGPMRGALGYTVAGGGDFDGDGHSDLIVAGYGLGTEATGAFAIYRGSSTGLIETPAWESTSIGQPGAQLTSSIAFVGDVNRDGHDDVVVGAYFWDGVEDQQGAIYAYYGR